MQGIRALMRTAGWLLTAVLLVTNAQAENSLDTIIIDRGVDEPIRIAVVPFAIDVNSAANAAILNDLPNPSDIVAFDLARSGQFDPMAKENMLSFPARSSEVFFRDWRILKTAYLVIGRVEAIQNDSMRMSFELYDVAGRRQLQAREYLIRVDQWRDAAHQIADIIYAEITGVRGAFSSKIMYVLAQNAGTPEARYRLEIADADGQRAHSVLVAATHSLCKLGA